MMARVAASTGCLMAVPLAISRVYAAEDSPTTEAKDVEAIPSSNGRLIRVSELPVYGAPAVPELLYEDEKLTAFRGYVSTMRQSVWHDVEKFGNAINKVQGSYTTAKGYGKDLVRYLQEDSGAFPRAVFITISGLGGIVAGYKGGVLRKTFFASAGLVTSASICYPYQAVDIARVGWQRSRAEATQLWQQTRAKDTKDESPKKGEESAAPSNDAPPTEAEKADKPATVSGEKTKDAIKVASKSETAPTDKPQKDFGMSKPEDKDMYSTRSS